MLYALYPRVGRGEPGMLNEKTGSLLPGEERDLAAFALDTAPVLIWMAGTDGRCTYFNATWLNFTGRTLDDVLGDGWTKDVHPEDVDLCLEIYRRALTTHEPFEMEYRLRRADGEYRWMIDRAVARWSPEGAFLGFIGSCHDITDIKLAHEAIEHAEERLNRIVSSAMDAIITIDEAHRITLFNAGAERIFGCTAEEALGRPIADFLPEPLRDGHDEHIRQFAASGVSERQMSPREIHGLRANGEVFPAEARISQAAVGDEKLFTVILRDITTHLRAEEGLRFLAEASLPLSESLDYHDTLQTIARLSLESFADWCAVHLVEEDGSISRVTVVHRDPEKEKFASQLQRRGADLRPIERVIRTGRPVFFSEIDDMIGLEGLEEDRRQLLRDLGVRSAIIAPLVGREGAIGSISFIPAESRRRYDERDLAVALEFGRRAGLAVENARLFEQLTQANAIKDEFLGLLSHELRTPLTTIIGLSSLLARDIENMSPEDRREAVEQLQVDSARLQTLIENLLILARLDRETVEKEPILLHHLVPAAVAAFQRLNPERKVDYRAAPGLPPIFGQPAWLTQVVDNLLSNANKYSPPGKPIEIEVDQKDDAISVRVLDRGEGIPEDQAENIFQPFFRGARASRTASGVGLGLAVCKRLLELQGGSIACYPREGGGAVFEFTMPVAEG